MRKIRDYVISELDLFRNECNFTEDERNYFDLKAKGLSHIQISLQMHISTSQTSNIARRVKSKMARVEN